MQDVFYYDLPGFPNLFLDYMYEFENTAPFFGTHYTDTSTYESIFANLTASRKPFILELVKAIAEGYTIMPCEKTRDYIKKLAAPRTVAVVTGQQLGIYGGPLYTIYKTMTAIKLCYKLKEQYPKYEFVPVFWLEGDDHDYEEVRHISMPGADNATMQIMYEPDMPFDDDKGSVGALQFSENIRQFHEEFMKNLRPTEFTRVMTEKLQTWYKPGATFKAAFKSLMFDLFDRYGLVLFDPQHPTVKQILRPVFQQAIEDHREIAEKLIRRSAALEETYHAQVKIKSVNLFYHIEHGRFGIEPEEDGSFRLKKKRQHFTPEQMYELIRMYPERFSPNVILRPICQDYLFPTAFYIAGPSEVSYFAQLIPLYEHFGIQQPIIYPRASLTLLEKPVAAQIDKMGINFRDIFIGEDLLQQKVFSSILQSDVNTLFDEAEKQIADVLEALQNELEAVDKTIADAGGRYKQKILGSLTEYNAKALEAQKRKNETLVRQVKKITDSVYPNQVLQERVCNYFYFANKYGPDLVDRIFEAMTIDGEGHQLIAL